MACGSCGERRRQLREQAKTVVSEAGSKPAYTVTLPDGSKETYTASEYPTARRRKRETNGTLTTST